MAIDAFLHQMMADAPVPDTNPPPSAPGLGGPCSLAGCGALVTTDMRLAILAIIGHPTPPPRVAINFWRVETADAHNEFRASDLSVA